MPVCIFKLITNHLKIYKDLSTFLSVFDFVNMCHL